jgi:hypothetical protein
MENVNAKNEKRKWKLRMHLLKKWVEKRHLKISDMKILPKKCRSRKTHRRAATSKSCEPEK